MIMPTPWVNNVGGKERKLFFNHIFNVSPYRFTKSIKCRYPLDVELIYASNEYPQLILLINHKKPCFFFLETCFFKYFH
jgi:hypothetical protein